MHGDLTLLVGLVGLALCFLWLFGSLGMRGVYEASILIAGINSDRTLLYITAPATRVVEILSSSVTNASNTTNQQIQCCWQAITTLGTPTATTLTPTKAEAGDQAAASTVLGNVTASEPTYTANTQFANRGFATLAGWEFAPVPEERYYIAANTTSGLRMLDTTPTAFDCVVRTTFREIG